MSLTWLLIFWVSILLIVYVYLGFPLLLLLVGNIRRRIVRKEPIVPAVSLIIAAYNEERNIASRLRNALALDYPREALEIIVASDGSTDSTDAIVESFGSRGVRLLKLPRLGKIHALNQAARRAGGELLIFSDANVMFQRGALRALVRNFADPQVGGAAGRTAYRIAENSETSALGEKAYWSFDTALKGMESFTGSVVSAHGGIYAIRRELYRPPADSAVTDDFAVSTGVIEQGFRLVFEEEAVAFESAAAKCSQEFSRKVRLMTRGWRGILLRRRLLNPFRYGFYSLILFSHKVLRRLVPWFLVLSFTSSVVLSPANSFCIAAALAQSLLYCLGGCGYLLRGTNLGRARFLSLPFFYCMANAAALVASIKLLCGERIEQWQPQRLPVKT